MVILFVFPQHYLSVSLLLLLSESHGSVEGVMDLQVPGCSVFRLIIDQVFPIITVTLFLYRL